MPQRAERSRFRRWTCVSALLALAAAAGPARPAPAPAPAAGAAKLRILMLPHLSYGVFYIARELGLYAAHGLDVEFVKLERSSGALPLLLQGELDVMTMAPSPALFHAVAAGERVRIVSAHSVNSVGGCAPNGLVVRTGVELAPGTRGLRVSANRAVLGGYILERLLEASGLDPAEQRFVDLSGPAELAAFLDGQIDAAVLSEPYRSRAEAAGAARLVVATRDVLPGLHGSLMVFGPRLLGDRELGQRFANAFLAAVAVYLEGHTPRNVDILARALDVERDLVDRCCWWPIPPSGRVEFAPLQAYQRWEVARGRLDRVVAPDEYWDGGFVERAAERLTGGGR